jgi:uncharacterized protein (DUF488 family)
MENLSLHTIYTVGHSNHTLEYFINLLKQIGISAIADVRSSPYSRFTPHFNKKELESSLKQKNISYVFLGNELGARVKDKSCYIDGRADYDLIAKTPLFQSGINRVIEGSKKYKIALMCAEKEPLDCHRTVLVAKQLKDKNINICHILADGKIEEGYITDKRLLKITKQISNDLFFSNPIETAYEIRGKQIAYQEKNYSIDSYHA